MSVESLHAQGDASSDELTDLALEDLMKVKVYAASKFVQNVARAPSSVSLVTAEEIRRHGYRTLADVLQSVRGFYVTDDRNYSYLGVRGFARPGDFNSRVLLLVNGHRLNDTIFEQALLGTESPLDIALIERVEVVRGPSSSLYGGSAFFAVVNVITRAGRSLQGIEVEGVGGSQERRGGRVTVGGRTSAGLEGLLSVSRFDNHGARRLYFPEFDVAGVDGVARDVDADRGVSIFGSLGRNGLKLQAGAGGRSKTVPTAPFGTMFNDPRTQTRDARGFVDLQYARQLHPRSSVQMRASYDNYAYDGSYAEPDGLFVDNGRGQWFTGEAALVRQFDHHGLTVGVEYRDDFVQNQSAADETGTLLDDRRRSQTGAVYAEDEFRFGPRVLLNAGLRWDQYFSTFGGTVNPRVGLIVLPREGTAVKALYGRAFRAPNPFELYYDQNALSATLAPERITTYEVIWEQHLAAAVQVTASGFQYRARDLIAQHQGGDTLDDLYYQNADSANATGVELEMQAELPRAIRARLARTFQSVVSAETGQALSNSPRHLSHILVDVPLLRTGLVAAFDGVHISRRRTVLDGVVGGVFVGNLTLSRLPAGKGLGVSVSIANAFDAAFGDPGSLEHRQQSIPQDGRTVGARVTWTF
jgi:iron complex outermembrane receptor protein